MALGLTTISIGELCTLQYLSIYDFSSLSGGSQVLEGVHPDLQLRAHLHSGGPFGRHRQTRPRRTRNLRRQRRETRLTGSDRFLTGLNWLKPVHRKKLNFSVLLHFLVKIILRLSPFFGLFKFLLILINN